MSTTVENLKTTRFSNEILSYMKAMNCRISNQIEIMSKNMDLIVSRIDQMKLNLEGQINDLQGECEAKIDDVAKTSKQNTSSLLVCWKLNWIN